MPVEVAKLVDDFNKLWPRGTDPVSKADDHIRMIKEVLQLEFELLYNKTRVFSFEKGAVVNPDCILYYEAEKAFYQWNGAYDVNNKYIVNAGSTPTTAGGIGGNAWTRSTGSGFMSTVLVSDTEPTAPFQNMLWWDTNSGTFFIYYNDGTSTQWVDLFGIADQASFNTLLFRHILARLAAEAGYNLVDGSFQTGAVTVNQNDVVWDWSSGKYYGGVIGSVSAGSTPATSGGVGAGAWVDRTEAKLRGDLNVVVKVFESVADMVADTNLYAGQKTETINYYTNLLGGGCKYKLFNSTDLVNINGRNDKNASYYADETGVFTTVGGLVAIPLDTPSFRRFGCVSDSITYSNVGTDSSSNAQALINFCAKTSQVAFVDSGKYYVHNLVQKKVYNGSDDTGGSQFLGVCLFGSSRDSSIIYTNGNDFMDLSNVYSIVAENLTIASDRVRTPALGDPQGKCLFSSASGNYVRPRLHKVDIQRFEYGIYSPTGSWSSVYDEVFFTYCKTGLKIERSYGSYVNKCSFICKTAIECFDTTCNSFDISNNQFALGSYCSVFGGVDTTLKLYIDSITMNNNYMEAYAAVDATAVIMDLKVSQTARGNIENTYINTALYSPIIRQLYGVNSQINTGLKFRQNRYITTGNPKIWKDGGSVNVPTFIFDDSPCTETTSNVIAMNQQYVSSRKAGISIATGQTAITLTDYIDSTMVGDQQIIAGGTLLLPVGHYDMHVYSRSTSTADIYLRLSKAGVNVDFKIAANGSITNTVTQTIVNAFAGGWTATLVNSLSSGTATLNDLVITITPIKVHNTLINKL